MATRLALGFGLMIIFLLLIGGVAAYATSQFAARVSHLGVQNTRRTVYLAVVEGAVRELREGVTAFVAAPDPQAHAAMARDTDRCLAKIDQNIRFLSAGARSQQEAVVLADFSRNYRQYLDARPRWLELPGVGKTGEAAQWRSRILLPAGAAMERALQELGRLGRQSSDAVEKQAVAEARGLRIILIGGLAIALLVGVTAAIAISRGIALPPGQTASAAAARQLAQRPAGHAPILAGAKAIDGFSKF